MFPKQPIHWECDEAFLLFLIPPLLYVPFFFRKYLKTENNHSKLKMQKEFKSQKFLNAANNRLDEHFNHRKLN